MSQPSRVSIVRADTTGYPATTPFAPSEVYPEIAKLNSPASSDPNAVYAAVRESFRRLGLDAAHADGPQWNPLGEVIRPGDKVLIKPNWVSQSHYDNDSWEQIITHGAVLRAVLDYVQLALGGNGAISLADGPMLSSDFAEIVRRTGAEAIREHYADRAGIVPIELIDLRSQFLEARGEVVFRRETLPGDPRGTTQINLGKHGAFYGFAGEGRYYGADYDTSEVNQHHRGEVQEYLLSGTAMQADVILDVPKLKSHHKAGVTMALKGVVGLNCGRNWLPHRTQGTPREGGDQFASSGLKQRLESRLVRFAERSSLLFPKVAPPLFRAAKSAGKLLFGKTTATIRGGGWHGNDTLWRMVHDINRSLMYGDAAGKLHDRPTKRRFVVIDGIVAGEGLGPTRADPVACGVILAGENAVAVDVAGTELMGFDSAKIPILSEALVEHALPLIDFPLSEVRIASNVDTWNGDLAALQRVAPFHLAAPLGWVDYIERRASRQQ